MGLLRFLAVTILAFGTIFGLFAYSPFFLEYNPVAYSVLVPDKLEGPLTQNDKLNSVERLFEGEVKWPESFAVHKGAIYTGVSDGRILKIDGPLVTSVRRTGKKCDGPWDEEVCGRPLGLRFDKNGLLYVADASYGLLSVDVKTGDMHVLVSSSSTVDGHKLNLVNDLVLDEESGIIYMTQSSTRWLLTKVIYMLQEPDRSGRILSYNTKTKKVTVLAKNLAFANGIELSPDRQRLIVAECGNFAVLQYHLSGPKKGILEPFLSNLPGEPDNIRRSKGGYWIAFNSIRTKSTLNLADQLSEYPLIRKVAFRLVNFVGSIMNYATQYIDSPALKELAFNVENGRFLTNLVPANGMILEVDTNGKILRSLQSTNGSIGHLSQVLEHDGYLYLGSWRNPFLGRIKA